MISRFVRHISDVMEMLAALALVGILGLVLTAIVTRALGRQIIGLDEFSAYCLVAIFFLALAPTYRRSEMIRVSLLLERLKGLPRRVLETLVTGVALVACVWATWWLGRMVYDSWRFKDVAQGLLATPLWVPQSLMVIGVGALVIALLEDFVALLGGKDPSYVIADRTSSGDVKSH